MTKRLSDRLWDEIKKDEVSWQDYKSRGGD